MTVIPRQTGPIEIPPKPNIAPALPNGATMYRTLVLAALAGLIAGLVDFITFRGSTDFLSHNYFSSDPQVSAHIPP